MACCTGCCMACWTACCMACCMACWTGCCMACCMACCMPASTCHFHTFTMSLPPPSSCYYPYLHHVTTHTFIMSLPTPLSLSLSVGLGLPSHFHTREQSRHIKILFNSSPQTFPSVPPAPSLLLVRIPQNDRHKIKCCLYQCTCWKWRSMSIQACYSCLLKFLLKFRHTQNGTRSEGLISCGVVGLGTRLRDACTWLHIWVVCLLARVKSHLDLARN